jgi:hypothetical protein
LEIIAVQANDGSLDFVNRRKILGFNIFAFFEFAAKLLKINELRKYFCKNVP